MSFLCEPRRSLYWGNIHIGYSLIILVLRLVLGICRLDGAVDGVQSDQRLTLLLSLPRPHRTSGRGKTWRTGQWGRRRGWLTIDIEPPVTDEVDLVEDGSVWAEEGVECVLRYLSPPTHMEHLTPTGGGAVSKVAWKCEQIEKSTKNLIVRHGGKILAICESSLGLIDPCSGPLPVFVRISRKIAMSDYSSVDVDIWFVIMEPEPEPALFVIWLWEACWLLSQHCIIKLMASFYLSAISKWFL